MASYGIATTGRTRRRTTGVTVGAAGCLLASLASPMGVGGAAPALAAPPGAPNVILILTDDQRQDGYLNAVMPNVASWFGEGGTRFTRASVAVPQCCPSRASVYSGQYAHNTGVTGSGGPGDCDVPFDERDTLQDELNGAGYRTAIIGKYLNHWPIQQRPPGFDRSIQVLEAGVAGGHYDVPVYDSATQVAGQTTGSRFETDWIADRTVDYLTQHDQFERANGDTPFFLVITPTSPHDPFDVPERYANAAVPGFDGNAGVEEDTPAELADKPTWVQERAKDANKTYYSQTVPTRQQRMTKAIDDLVGRLRDKLAATGESSSTLAMFTSDNGYMWGEHGLTQKNVPYTKSIRVPLYVRWPGRVDAGRSDDRLTVNVDLAPTVYDAVGLTPDYPRDGRSLLRSCPTYCRDTVLTEFYGPTPDPEDPKAVPTWTSVRTESGQYVEYYRDQSRTTVVDREFYADNDPEQLTNRLNDGTTVGDPVRADWEALINRYEDCSGIGTGASSCP